QAGVALGLEPDGKTFPVALGALAAQVREHQDGRGASPLGARVEGALEQHAVACLEGDELLVNLLTAGAGGLFRGFLGGLVLVLVLVLGESWDGPKQKCARGEGGEKAVHADLPSMVAAGASVMDHKTAGGLEARRIARRGWAFETIASWSI